MVFCILVTYIIKYASSLCFFKDTDESICAFLDLHLTEGKMKEKSNSI